MTINKYAEIPIDQSFKQSNVNYSVKTADSFILSPVKFIQ